MYVGGTDIKALHHLVYEVVDNSIDEALAGVCTASKSPSTRFSVTVDNGRGIPVGMHPTEKKSALEVVMTKLHAGGKFGGGGYKVSGGLHGVGVSAVNALSEWCEVEVKRDGQIHFQRYRTRPSQGAGQGDREGQKPGIPAQDHFQIRPDHLHRRRWISASIRWSSASARWRLSRAGLPSTLWMSAPTRMNDLLFRRRHHLLRPLFEPQPREVLHPVVYVEKEIEGIGIEAAIQYTDAYTESVYSFANTINTIDGGTHLTGLRSALTRVVNDYARKNGLLKEADPNFSGDDTREGLTAIISIKHPTRSSRAQTKVKLMNPEVQTYVQQVRGRGLRDLPGREPAGCQGHHCQVSHLGARTRCRPQGARPGHPQVGAGVA
jgi:DNA gyrase subunit B